MFLSKKKNKKNEVFLNCLYLSQKNFMFQSPDEIFAFFQKEELGSTTFSTRCAFLQVLCNYTKQLLFVSLTNEKLSQAGLYNSVKLLSNFIGSLSSFYTLKGLT